MTNYLSSPVLQKAKENIQNPHDETHYEHQVGTWMGTLLKNVFTGDPWAITPERRRRFSKECLYIDFGNADGGLQTIFGLLAVKRSCASRVQVIATSIPPPFARRHLHHIASHRIASHSVLRLQRN